MSFDCQPVLKGDLVELRPLRSQDYSDFYAVAADPLIWEQHPDKKLTRQVFSGHANWEPGVDLSRSISHVN